jgi:hypothetical protein
VDVSGPPWHDAFMIMDDPTEPDLEAFDLMIGRAREELVEKIRFNARTFGLVDRCPWSLDLAGGFVRFGMDDGRVLVAPMQIVGMLHMASRTWVWGSDNPSVPQDLRGHATMTKAFAAECGIDRLKEPAVQTTEGEAWDLMALAVLLSSSQGGMKGQRAGSPVFMTHGTPIYEQRR